MLQIPLFYPHTYLKAGLIFLVCCFGLPLFAQDTSTAWLEAVQKRMEAAMLNNDFPGAKTIWEGAMDTASTRFGTESLEVADLLESGGTLSRFEGDYKAYAAMALKCLTIRKKQLGLQHVKIASAMVFLADAKRLLGDYDTIESLTKEAIAMLDELNQGISDEKARAYSGLATFYEMEGYMLQAGTYHKKALEIEQQLHGDKRYEFGVYANNLAVLLHILSNYNQAIHYYDLSLANAALFTGKEHPDYIITQKNKGAALNNIGRFREAEKELSEALAIARKIYPPDDAEISYYLRALAMYYRTTGQYDQSVKMLEEALGLLKNKFGDKHPQYLNTLLTLTYDYDGLGNKAAAESALKTVIAALEATKRTKTLTYAQTCTMLGQFYIDQDRLVDARRIMEPAMLLADSISGKNTPDFYEKVGAYWVNLFTAEGNTDEAIRQLDFWHGILSKSYDAQHDRMIDWESLYGSALRKKGDWAGALKHYKTAWAGIQSSFNNRFAYLSMENRAKFTNSYRIYQEMIQILARSAPNEPEVQGFMFDVLLFQKELLAWYDRQLLESWHTTADSNYAEYRDVRQMIARQMTMPIESRKDLETLEKRRQTLEEQLAQQLKPLPLRAPTWQQVQQGLRPGEAAVEFFSAKTMVRGEKHIYVALVLTPGANAPRFVRLGDIDNVNALFASKGAKGLQYAGRVYASDALYRQLWAPLEPFLADIKQVYYVPVGSLHLLNIDAIPAPNGQLLSERYTLIRLGNSMNLLQAGFRQKQQVPATAVLVGGLNYEKADQTLPATGPSDLNRGFAPRGLSGQDWPPLPQTLVEVENVAAMLQKKDVSTQVYTDGQGTEAAIKKRCMEGSPPGILHFATHGFFFEKSASSVSGMPGLATADNPMYRSGLILSGANPSWKGQSTSTSTDDGILTAEEITLFKLKNTDLVILSACETGLGDTRDDEGVYGLQRAFRLAGARSIIMTLWRIPDAPTRVFMENFYAALLEGGDSRSAFQQARSAMRKAFPHPYYWAGFVLAQ